MAAGLVPEQLEMLLGSLDGLPPLEVPPGYSLRTYRDGDAAHWARLMNDCIGSGWTEARCLAEHVRRPQFHPEGCFFVEDGAGPQGTATAWRSARRPELGYVHMVGVAPEHRGRGLGRAVTLATLHRFRDEGLAGAFLNTDDWRIPAIRVYLRMGFRPVRFDAAHAERWDRVEREIAAR